MACRVEFGGGLESLFDNQRVIDVSLSGCEDPPTISWLLQHLKTHHLSSSRLDLFLAGSSIRPGILVIINDVDWELEGELDYVLQDRDVVTFISTLHGG